MSSIGSTVSSPGGYVSQPYASRRDVPASWIIWYDGTYYRGDVMSGPGNDISNADAGTTIQQVLNAIPNDGYRRRVLVKSASNSQGSIGVWSIVNTITPTTFNHIWLDSDGLTLKLASGVNRPILQLPTTHTDNRISGFVWDMNVNNETAPGSSVPVAAIMGTDVSSSLMEVDHNTFQNSRSTLLSLGDNHLRVHHNTFQNSGSEYGYITYYPPSTYIGQQSALLATGIQQIDINIQDNYFHANYGDFNDCDVAGGAGSSGTFSGNYFENWNQRYSVTFQGMGSTQVVGNEWYASGANNNNGCLNVSAGPMTVSGNIFQTYGQAVPAHINDAVGIAVTITGNSFTGTTILGQIILSGGINNLHQSDAISGNTFQLLNSNQQCIGIQTQTGAQITGNTFWLGTGLSNAQAIAFLSSLGTAKIDIAHNIFQLQSGSAIGGNQIAAATFRTWGNTGYNPQGWAITTPSVPASGSDAQNTTGSKVKVYITGVGTGITGYSITDPSGSRGDFTRTVNVGDVFELDWLAKIRLAYTGVPAWSWYGL